MEKTLLDFLNSLTVANTDRNRFLTNQFQYLSVIDDKSINSWFDENNSSAIFKDLRILDFFCTGEQGAVAFRVTDPITGLRFQPGRLG